MCGIVGILSKNNVVEDIYSSLQRLEYRGYDSAGIATIDNDQITRCRAEGKLKNLQTALQSQPIKGNIGIGHTRWATHGAPNEVNAHPHATEQVAVVHNGIIENYIELKDNLQNQGYSFKTQTDTEVIPVLITSLLEQGMQPAQAFTQAIKQLKGAFALCVVFANQPNFIAVAKKGSPLAIGYGEGEMYIASDAIALAPLSKQVCYLEEGDYAFIALDKTQIFDAQDNQVQRAIKQSNISGEVVGKGNYRHYMHKEIHEQPVSIADTLHSYVNFNNNTIELPKTDYDFSKLDKVTIIACGTSYYAGITAKYWIEQFAKVPVEVEIASEYRYRRPVFTKNGLVLLISQSGETADTLACLRLAKQNKQFIASIVNVVESSIARESDFIIPTLCGPEIGVASTKAFTSQLACLACMALYIAKDKYPHKVKELGEIPAIIQQILKDEQQYLQIANDIQKARSVLYLGRGTSFAIAMEGALKLKEISYIHAEGYAGGELKHGPIALIDEQMPIIAIMPEDKYYDKMLSNIQEVAVRGGKIILLSTAKGCKELADICYHTIELPHMDEFITPFIYSIPVQLLAYHTAVVKGTDVDQPRNLAKSVTVE